MVRSMFLPLGLVVIMAVATSAVSAQGSVQKKPFGKTADGTEVDLYTLTNKHGMVAKIMTYGGIVTELHVPDRHGKLADVCLGFDNLEAYLAGHPHFGAITGRVANRIAKGKFSLNGKDYSLFVNNGPNSLHGGKEGFDKKVWTYMATVDGPDYVGIKLHYTSKDGEEGYPGTLSTFVTYSLTDANELKIDYAATTDAPTPVNLTNHAYFNLTGGSEDVLGHQLSLNCYRYTPADETGIPTGEIKEVIGTPLDFFTKDALIGDRIKQLYDTSAKGYDHNYLILSNADMLKLGMETLQKKAKELGDTHPDVVKGRQALEAQVAYLKTHPDLLKTQMKRCAVVTEPKSGRVMTVYTSEPAVQLYTGNFLDGKYTGHGGVNYKQHAGLCLEAQHYPNSVNTPSFPTTILKPGETYQQTTIYGFSAK
jgi:aldose 1-epimerase